MRLMEDTEKCMNAEAYSQPAGSSSSSPVVVLSTVQSPSHSQFTLGRVKLSFARAALPDASVQIVWVSSGLVEG